MRPARDCLPQFSKNSRIHLRNLKVKKKSVLTWSWNEHEPSDQVGLPREVRLRALQLLQVLERRLRVPERHLQEPAGEERGTWSEHLNFPYEIFPREL